MNKAKKKWLTTFSKTFYGMVKSKKVKIGQNYFAKKILCLRKLAEEMHKVWAKIGRGNELSFCKNCELVQKSRKIHCKKSWSMTWLAKSIVLDGWVVIKAVLRNALGNQKIWERMYCFSTRNNNLTYECQQILKVRYFVF